MYKHVSHRTQLRLHCFLVHDCTWNKKAYDINPNCNSDMFLNTRNFLKLIGGEIEKIPLHFTVIHGSSLSTVE